MIDITTELTAEMTATNRLLCQEMLRRGWHIQIPYWYVSNFYITRSDGRRLHIFSSTPPTVSYVAGLASNDKLATIRVLEANGVEQLPTHIIAKDDPNATREFMQQHAPVVVKPLDGSHGNGITVGVADEELLAKAVAFAEASSSSGRVIVQKQFIGEKLEDIRVLIIDGVLIGAIHRVPARVCGDGRSTVGQLIEQENDQSWRGEPYKNKLATIDIARASEFLGQRINHVPAEAEFVTVAGVANYGAGGELIDVTDDVPRWMRDESIKIADVLGLGVVGVDYMLSCSINKNMPQNPQNATVIEVNKSPSLCIHDEPTVGTNRGATKAYVDYLANL